MQRWAKRRWEEAELSQAETPVETWWPSHGLSPGLQVPLVQSPSLWPQFPYLDNQGSVLAAPSVFTGLAVLFFHLLPWQK